jgi:hypothetical protein
MVSWVRRLSAFQAAHLVLTQGLADQHPSDIEKAQPPLISRVIYDTNANSCILAA